MKQFLKKTKDDTEVTLALLAYHDTPISEKLPSPAELFFGRRINNRIGLPTATALTDQQKDQLAERRAAHLRRPRTHGEFHPNQPVWFTDDTTPEW